MDMRLATRGSLLGEFFWDWSRARADFERAIAYDAGNGTAQRNYSALLSSLGLVREALVAARRAIDADPLSGAAWDNLGAILMRDGQLVAARAAVLRAQQLNPNSFWPPYNLAQIELLDGHPEKALTVAQTTRNPALVMTAMAAYTLGRGDEAERALNEILSRQPQIFGYQIAEIYAWRGENDQAFEWLERSYAQHDPGLSSVYQSVPNQTASGPTLCSAAEEDESAVAAHGGRVTKPPTLTTATHTPTPAPHASTDPASHHPRVPGESPDAPETTPHVSAPAH
jgi:predicted Zn-dependent protease